MYHFPLVFETSSSLSYNSTKICYMPPDVLNFLLHLFVCMCVAREWQAMCVGVRGQYVGILFLLPSCMSWG